MGFWSSFVSGRHEGKGIKFYRNKQFKKALNHFLSALALRENEDDEDGEPLLVEHIANTYVALENYAEALNHYKTSNNMYKQYENIHKHFKSGVVRTNSKIIEIEQYIKSSDSKK